MFRIAHISDLHCGSPYFIPNLLERAISEINELGPEMVICSGDLTTFGFKEEYAQAKGLPRPDRVRAVVVVPGQPRLPQRGLRPLREPLRRPEPPSSTWAASPSSPWTRPSPTSTTGRSAAAATAGSRSSSRRRPTLRIFVLHHHLLPVPGTGRERNVVYDAGDALECLQRAGVDLVLSGHKHVPYAWKLENLFIVNAGTVSSLRLRGNTRPCYNVIEVTGGPRGRWRKYPFHGQERIIQFSTRDARIREVHGADRGRGDDAAVKAVASIDGEHYAPVVRDAIERLPHEVVAAVLVGGTEKLRGGDDYGVPLCAGPSRRRSTSRAPGARLRPLGRAGARAARAAFASRAGRLPGACPIWARTSGFDPPALAPFELPSLGIVGTGKRIGKTAVSGYAARLLSRSRDVVVVAMGRGGPPEPELMDVRGRRWSRCSPWLGRAATRPRTTSRTRRWPAWSRSGAAAAAAASRERR